MTETIPKNEYETTDGTPAVAHGTHEARTVVRTTTTGDEVSTYMMTEIGDGVFVQWSQCAGCSNGVAACTCTDGPKEPAYISRWRDARFDRSLDTRPEIEFEALPAVVKQLKKHGYTVLTKEELNEYATAIREAFAAPKTEVTDEQLDTFHPDLDKPHESVGYGPEFDHDRRQRHA